MLFFDNAANIFVLQKQGACLNNAANISALQKQGACLLIMLQKISALQKQGACLLIMLQKSMRCKNKVLVF